jgi:hypothetical protein
MIIYNVIINIIIVLIAQMLTTRIMSLFSLKMKGPLSQRIAKKAGNI